MKRLVLNTNDGTGRRRLDWDKLSSLFKCHLSRIVNAAHERVCVPVITACRVLLHTDTQSGSPCAAAAAAQHYAGSDSTTIGLCLKVCLVSRLLPRISPSDSVSMAHCSESPLKKQSIRKLVRNETGAADLPVQRLPRPGATVN